MCCVRIEPPQTIAATSRTRGRAYHLVLVDSAGRLGGKAAAYGSLVQSVERRTVNPYVGGSSPPGAARGWVAPNYAGRHRQSPANKNMAVESAVVWPRGGTVKKCHGFDPSHRATAAITPQAEQYGRGEAGVSRGPISRTRPVQFRAPATK